MVATATLQNGKNELNEEQRDYPAALPGPEYKMVLAWKNIILFILMHTAALYGLFAEKSSWTTIIVSECCHIVLKSHYTHHTLYLNVQLNVSITHELLKLPAS